MLNPEATPMQLPLEREIAPAEALIADIKDALGSRYYVETHSKTAFSPQNALFIYKEIAFRKRGLFGSNSKRVGAQTLLTLIADSTHAREIDKQKTESDLLNSPVNRIDGWMPEDGRSLVTQSIDPSEIPPAVRDRLSKVPYFATAERFTFIYQKLPVNQFLMHKLEEVRA